MSDDAIEALIVFGLIACGLGITLFALWALAVVGFMFGMWATALVMILIGAPVLGVGIYFASERDKDRKAQAASKKD